jgi:hypothetical protein
MRPVSVARAAMWTFALAILLLSVVVEYWGSGQAKGAIQEETVTRSGGTSGNLSEILWDIGLVILSLIVGSIVSYWFYRLQKRDVISANRPR